MCKPHKDEGPVLCSIFGGRKSTCATRICASMCSARVLPTRKTPGRINSQGLDHGLPLIYALSPLRFRKSNVRAHLCSGPESPMRIRNTRKA